MSITLATRILLLPIMYIYTIIHTSHQKIILLHAMSERVNLCFQHLYTTKYNCGNWSIVPQLYNLCQMKQSQSNDNITLPTVTMLLTSQIHYVL